ncbi:hypothetical protein GFL93_09350 [Rhizobium leguminosarum bv. viciae]|uniref:terminase small subunit-like protein n=1 Tax=Rhizobium TaxID=379 RepID=UPI0014412DF0|nr:hypothetical protein [Rhizobium leguminosarum]NKK06076.1 hypothetical protein [Rhizobium leguminosarum bv. viciae]
MAKKGEVAIAAEKTGAGGRPSDYTLELAEAICELIIKGMSVRKIGDLEAMPCEDTIYTWLSKHSEFSEKYTEACQHRTNRYLEECVDLADTMPDGIMFIAGNGNLYTRDEVLQLNAQERAMAGLMPIGLSNELINKRKLQIDTRLKAAARMHPRRWGDKSTMALEGGDKPVAVNGEFKVILVRPKESSDE